MGQIQVPITKFVDLDLSFSKHPVSSDVSKLNDVEAIKASIRNLLYTQKYESPFNTDLNSPVYTLIFENASPILKHVLEAVVSQVITNFEPRAQVLGVEADVDNDRDTVSLTIIFQPINLNQPVVYTVLMERVR